MNEQLFREIEARYKDLKNRVDQGKITPDLFKQELKKMMIQDPEGRYWMIGGKTGGWYLYENNAWQSANPFKPAKQKSLDRPTEVEPEKKPEEVLQTEKKQTFEVEKYGGVDDSAASSHKNDIYLYGGLDDSQPQSQAKDLSSYGGLEESASVPIQPKKASPSHGETKEYADTRTIADYQTGQADSRNRDFSEAAAGRMKWDQHTGKDSEAAVESRKEPLSKPQQNSKADSAEAVKIVPCRYCGSQIAVFSQYCPLCGGNQKKDVGKSQSTVIAREGEIVIRSFHVLSFLIIFGMIGMAVGLIVGASFSIFEVGGDLIYQFPQMMQDARGKMPGAFLFGGLGGLLGFVLFAISGMALAFLYNGIAAVFGGIRFKSRS